METDSQWLKNKSQQNRCQRYQQLELDFGPEFSKASMDKTLQKKEIIRERSPEPKITKNSIDILLKEKQLNKRISHVTEDLMLSLRINPEAFSLIASLGSGSESTTREALRYWVKTHVKKMDNPLSNQELLSCLQKQFIHDVERLSDFG